MSNILVILLTMLVLLTAVDAADKVRISISNLSGQFMTYPLAHTRGFLKEEGIEAEIIRVTGGAASAAMSSGDLDYGTGMAVGEAITGALPVKVVACFVPAPVFALVARPEINSVHELKDKTVEFLLSAVYPSLALASSPSTTASIQTKISSLWPSVQLRAASLG
jgi:ABC-type nitrate/sulfonate/bicarbonate transport system substrate-binding protein